jgi:hypothetical protein
MAKVAVGNLQNHRLLPLVYLDGKLLQALLLALAYRYEIAVEWMLLWVKRAPSPCLFLLGIVGLCLKDFMLAIDIASTYGFLCCTLDQWSLMKSATRSVGLQRPILALLIFRESLVSIVKACPYDTYHDCDITQVALGGVFACIPIKKRSCFHGQGAS